jgi:hypothetical protein
MFTMGLVNIVNIVNVNTSAYGESVAAMSLLNGNDDPFGGLPPTVVGGAMGYSDKSNGIADEELERAGYTRIDELHARMGARRLHKCMMCKCWWKQVSRLGKEILQMCDKCGKKYRRGQS